MTAILAEKPRFSQPTSAIGLDDPSLIRRDPQVVTATAADRAGNFVNSLHEEPHLAPERRLDSSASLRTIVGRSRFSIFR
jgi:hypothetical protein